LINNIFQGKNNVNFFNNQFFFGEIAMSWKKTLLLWGLSIVIMALVVLFQFTTGPSYPFRGKVNINQKEITYQLPRSHNGEGNEPVKICVPDNSVTGKITYRRFQSYDEFETHDMTRRGDTLYAEVPWQIPAGKVEYRIELKSGQETKTLSDKMIYIRFTGSVPKSVLFIHILMMFISITLSIRAGFEVIFKGERVLLLTILTLASLLVGGFYLGPLMQKYAFNDFWTGWPLGHDLTDNKTAIALVFWIVGILFYLFGKKWKNILIVLLFGGIAVVDIIYFGIGWVSIIAMLLGILYFFLPSKSSKHLIVASAILLIIYLIPHSLLGSQVDFRKLPKKTAMIDNFESH
jgi:hypothetical protein